MQTFSSVVVLGLAGAAGTLMRAGCNTAAERLFGPGYPWGTLFVNVVGSLVFGIVVAAARSRGLVPAGWEAPLLVGLLGGFTTFSTFAFQSLEMLEAGRIAAAAAYVVATNVAAIAAVWGGLRLLGS
jgi:CrcB protein